MANTLSIPELLNQVLSAFKIENPELLSFSNDFSSKTAVLGDRITAHIAHTPVTSAYDPTPQVGFYSGAQDVTTLIEDVPVTLSRLDHVPVRVKWLQGLASKVDLFEAALHDIAFALGKKIVDSALNLALTNTSNTIQTAAALSNLDWFDGSLRSQLNGQKVAQSGRWCFINSKLADALGSDDRVRSRLFFSQKNGATGIRTWSGVGGFQWIKEYVDFPAGGIRAAGLAGDKRLFAVAMRSIEDASKVAEQLGIKKVMAFYPLLDEESQIPITGISFQEPGTGDLILSVAALWGVHCGNDGGAAGSQTDAAGTVITTV